MFTFLVHNFEHIQLLKGQDLYTGIFKIAGRFSIIGYLITSKLVLSLASNYLTINDI